VKAAAGVGDAGMTTTCIDDLKHKWAFNIMENTKTVRELESCAAGLTMFIRPFPHRSGVLAHPLYAHML
jgi:hypothetical protein